MSLTLRHPATQRQYELAINRGHLKDLRDEEQIIGFRYFKIINNRFPHDRVAATHHLLVPRRKFNHWTMMNRHERKEFKKIDIYLSQHYDCIKLNYPSVISVPDVIHWHLYVLKK